MYFSSYGPATVQALIAAAGYAIQETATLPQVEQEREIHYLWVLARKT
jgi:hypothetical protein